MSTRRVRARRLSLQTLEARDVPAVTVPVGPLNPAQFFPGRVVVKMTGDEAPKSPLVKDVRELGGGYFLVHLKANIGVARGIRNMATLPGVEIAEPDFRYRAALIPNDTSFGSLYGLHNTGQSAGTVDADIDAPEAWDVSTGNGSITVGVIDTGIDYRHVDLYKNIWINRAEIPAGVLTVLTDTDADGRITFWDLNEPVNQGPGKIIDVNGNARIDAGDILAPVASGGWADGVNTGGNPYTDDLIGWDFVNNDNNPLDDNNHGTHVAGTIGAMGNNGTGVAGVNFKAQMAGLKFLSAGGSGSLSGAINAMNYAVAAGMKVTNNSWGGGGFSASLNTAIANAASAGQLFVAAAGNAGTNNDTNAFYPANYAQPNVLSVGASTRTDARASFSNFGATTVDLFAPGSSILSTTPNNTYSSFSGTSMAAPHMAGAVALVWDAHPTWTYQEVITAILSTVDVKSAFQGLSVTGGRLNVDRAIRSGGVSDTAGPRVTGSIFNGSPVSSLRVTFSESINPLSFDASDVSFAGPEGSIGVAVTPVAGSTTQFDVSFSGQTAPGDYTMVIGPNVSDVAGNAMNQNGNGLNGENPGDVYSTTMTIAPPDTAGPQVTSAAFNGTQSINALRVTFNEAVNPASFSPADAALTGPGGAIAVTSVSPVAGSGNTQFDLVFATQTAPGTYTMVVGPDVTDSSSNPMNQDGDAINGEPVEDQFAATTTIVDTTGPRVTASAFNGTTTTSSVRFTFSEAINPTSFDATDATLTGPAGSIGISGVTPVAGSGNTQFDVTFATQSAPGLYTMVIGPQIMDGSGNPMNQDNDAFNGEDPADKYTATRTLSSTQVFNSTDVGKSIRDVATTISVLTINQDINIADLNVTMNLSHTWDSDLRIRLIGPDGTQVLLVNRRGGSGNNFQTTTLNDEAASSVASGFAPFNGSYRPEQSLTAFDGKNARGTWQLVIEDVAMFDVGRINAWSLTVQS